MNSSTSATLPEQDREGTASLPPGHGGIRARVVLGVIVSIAMSCAAAVALPFVPVVPPTASGVTGAAVFGIGLGWVVLAALTARATGRWQTWALAGAAVFLTGGLLLLVIGAPAMPVLDRVWPAALAALAICIGVAARQRRLPRRVLLPMVALVALASMGGALETAAEAIDAASHPAPGRLIDVGDHRLHLRCAGTGSPTVVFEAGGGEMSSNLGLLTPAVARTTRICTYDRAGRGWSEPDPTPSTGSRIASDLHALLHRSGISGPFVLAGHSFGGLYVQSFAAQYPDEVAGLVLVDSTAPRAASEDQGGSVEPLHRAAALLSSVARFGLARLIASVTGDDLPAPYADEVRMSASTPSSVQSTLDEYIDARAATEAAADLTDLGAKPLVVLTARIGNSDAWFAAQDRMTGLSTNAVHRTLPVDHQGLVGEPEGATATAQGIRDAVASARAAQPLPQR